MSITRNFKLFLNAGFKIPLVIHANQYDQGETWNFTLYNSDGSQYTPTTGAIVGMKSDGNLIANAGTVNSAGQVVITETEQMTAAAGKAVYELQIDSDTHGTANFIVMVEPSPTEGGTASDSDLSLMQEVLNVASAIPTGGTVGQVMTKTATGAEWDDVIDESDISQSVSDWMEANITATTPSIDTSLTVSGAAADSKTVGDEISILNSALKYTADNTGIGDKTIILDSWEFGGYNGDGAYVTSDKIKTKALIPVSKGQTYVIKYNGQTAMDVVRYTSDDFSGGTIIDWGVSADITHTMANDYYLGIALRSSDLGVVKPVIAQKNVIALVENAIGNTAYTPSMIQYGTSSADGSLVARNDRICTEIKYRTEDVSSISIGDGYQFLIALFNDSGDFLGNTSWGTTIEKSSITGSNFRITVKANNGNGILPDAATGLTINLESQSTTDLLLKLYDDREERLTDDADLKKQISDIKSVVIADSIGFNQIARLGWKPYAGYFPPEQSLASYKLAYSMGMRMLLADVRKTSDNVLVCFHDASINSTARNSNGTTISETINIVEHTLAELNAYDYGIYKGYPNEGILTLDAFLKLCGQINCVPILETKIWLLVEEVNSIVTMVRKYGLQDGFIWAEMPESTIANRTCTIIRQKLPNATIMIRGGSYSNEALSSAVAFSSADKKTILSFTDYTYITAETVATCRENNIDIEYSMVSTEAEMDVLYANSAFGDIRYIVCSEFNVHDYLMDKIGVED